MGSTKLRSRLRCFSITLLLCGLVSLVAVVGNWGWKMYQLGQVQKALRSEASEEQYTALYVAGRYEALVKQLDEASLEYSENIQKLGGLTDPTVQIALLHQSAMHNGIGAIFCHLNICADYNAKHQPASVEQFLAMAAQDSSSGAKGNGYLAPAWQDFSKYLLTAEEPILKAYGLWFLGRYDEYRNFVYDLADNGIESLYGLAAHAAQYDSDKLRAIRVVGRYYQVIRSLENWESYDIMSCTYWIKTCSLQCIENGVELDGDLTMLLEDAIEYHLNKNRDNSVDEVTRELLLRLNRGSELKMYEKSAAEKQISWRLGVIVDLASNSRWTLDKFSKGDVDILNTVLDRHLAKTHVLKYEKDKVTMLFKLAGREADLQ